MTIVIMLFTLPLGIAFYFFDKKTRKENKDLFDSYVSKIKHSDLNNKEKLSKIDNMYYENSYKRIFLNESELIVENKHFNLGVLFIFFGVANYFGIVFFLIYYKYILKPEQIVVNL